MRLENKLAVVTAAASGMGRAGVETFVREGAQVVAVDINEAALESLVRDIGPAVKPLATDLTDAGQCRSFIHKAADMLGGIDLLWSHAGTAVDGKIEGLDMAEYERSVMLNLTSSVLAAGEAISHMRKRGGGAILFTGSTAGLVGSMASPVYSAEKFAVVGFTKSLAQRFAPDNVRVNVVCPSIADTPMKQGFIGAHDDPEAFEKVLKASIPLGRFASAQDVANAALFLLSDEASFITGVALPVDGGFTAR